MRAKVKATGEIVEVCFSPTNCIEAGGKRWWKTSELDFSPIKPDAINPFPPMEMFDISTPMEMSYDPQSMTARFVQDMNIRVTKEVVEKALKIATNKQLRDELKRRADESL